MPTRRNQGVYLYNGFAGLIGLIIVIVILNYVGGIYVGIITWLFPADEYSHLSAIGDPTLIAVQHGIIYRPWVSIPLFMFYFLIATNIGAYFMDAASLAAEDHAAVCGDKENTGLLGPLAYGSIALARGASLYMVLALPLVAILPYGSGFALFLMMLSVIAATFGLLLPLPFIVLNWRFVMAAVGMTKGKLDAGQFIRERDRMRHAQIGAIEASESVSEGKVTAQTFNQAIEKNADDKSSFWNRLYAKIVSAQSARLTSEVGLVSVDKPDVKPIQDKISQESVESGSYWDRLSKMSDVAKNAENEAAGEDRAPMNDEPKLPKIVPVIPPKTAIIPDQNEPTLPSDNPLGSVLNRFATRQQTKEVEANTELKEAQAKNIAADSGIMDAHTERLRSYAQMKGAQRITETDDAEREISYLDAQARLREARERAYPPQPEVPEPQKTDSPASDAASQFAAELASEFAPSPAQEIRNAAEREIMKMLDGLPEENATEPLRKRIAAIRQRAEQMIKDSGLK